MKRIKCQAKRGPRAQYGAPSPTVTVQAKNTNWCVVHAVEDTCTRREVVHLLGPVEVARMEDHAEDPTREAKVSEEKIVFSQWVGLWDGFAQLAQAPVMGQIVEQTEDDGEGLLHPQEPIEGPFAMELEDGFSVWRIAGFSLVRDYVLAGVIALVRARPEKEATLKRFEASQLDFDHVLCPAAKWSFIRIGIASWSQFVFLQTYREAVSNGFVFAMKG